MVERELVNEIVGIAAVALIGLLSLPGLKYTATKTRFFSSQAPVAELYEDQDGISTEASVKAYSDTRPRIATWIVVVIGLGVTAADKAFILSVQDPSEPPRSPVLSAIESWTNLAAWVLLCLQCASLPLRYHYLLKFRLAFLGVISSILLSVSIAVRNGYDALAAVTQPDATAKILGAVRLVQFGLAIGAAGAFASFPRRPDVYDREALVDQQHTLSLLERMTFSWNRMVFDIAKERQMQITDMPGPDYRTKSGNLRTRFLARKDSGRLWWRLIKAFSGELALQWVMTLIIAILALFPQVVLYNFLERIESRASYRGTDPTLFVWVFGLFLSQILLVAMNNWLKWVTDSRLDTPVGSLLQSLVFAKALKQYETAAPGTTDKDGKKDGNSTDKNLDKAGAKPEKGKDKGTRQSVINHMKLDSNRVTIFCMYNNNFPSAVYKLALAGGFLSQLMGWKAVVAGLTAGALMAPISTWMSRKYTKIHFSLMKYRDGKAHLLTEALQGMRQIRFSALEEHWEEKIMKSRNEELAQYWKSAVWSCVLVFIVNLGPLLLASVAFSVYAWENGTNIRASVIFTSLGLLEQLEEAIAFIPLLQMYMVEAYTSCVRLEKYLNQTDKEFVSSDGKNITFEDATVAWPAVEDSDQKSDEEAADSDSTTREIRSILRGVNLVFPEGELSVVTGQTGSGKSLLLAAILGEVKLLSGTVHVPVPPSIDETLKSIPESEWVVPQLSAFVSQTPWIEGGSVQENIVFGLPMVPRRYRKVLHACALEKDIELLVDGDQTEVGPKGVTLSGGQRWRVALARALYSRAGTIILDDVLSAVDAHVGRLIVSEALTGELARGRTRILATHHAELVLPYASYLVRLADGKLDSAEQVTPSADGLRGDDMALENGSGSSPDDSAEIPMRSAKDLKSKEEEESREVGRVKWTVYYEYFKASGGIVYWTLGLLILLLSQAISVVRTWSLKELAQQASTSSASERSFARYMNSQQVFFGGIPTSSVRVASDGDVYFWVAMYIGLYLALNTIQVVRVLGYFLVSLRASRILFKRMTHAILRAPLRWIDTVPAGRILNRFTSDTFTVDRRLTTETFTFLRTSLGLLVIIGTSLTVSPYVIVFGLLLLGLYVRIANEYITAAREVKRINSVSHSPIYDQFSSVLSGLSTIRAYGRTEYYMDRMLNLIDNSTKASWALQLSARWMALRMGMLGALFVTVVATAIAFGGVNAALAGFSLTFALRYTGFLTRLLSGMTSVELGFNACERVLEYTKIETEPEGGNDAPAAWPTAGRIEIENLTVAYSKDLPPVLKNLNFTVNAGERIGIIGRTGAGKSTFASVLFRLLDPREGTVHIDGIDIASLKLAHLRSRLAIIPQDPFLFSGTLRSNLDMENTLDDYELVAALKRVHLIHPDDDSLPPTTQPATPPTEATSSTAIAPSASETDPATDATEAVTLLDTTLAEDGAPTVNPADASQAGQPTDNTSVFTDLSTAISTGGANLSQGQRQLVCLARALLTRPKIVVLDEATSAVDRGTDTAIQESLREEFVSAGCTVLVIAHRLSTVADFDRLLVLDKGRVAEIGSPRELLEAGMAHERELKGSAAETPKGKQKLDDTEEQTIVDSDEEAGGTTRVNSPDDSEDEEVDGTGAFWRLVQKSAEKDKLLQMIMGKDASNVA
ncbi:P-loop containing nucleoside triphosphate hydrolase protein [Thozetella sp. PMI_491]|nr:P-loop containing nucleoside triphosphate hydrolase protein [Thozetella sp. PMI_491]